ncbi:hypothetical protein GCM10020295_55810 [Streptomyces cinereospinus]
MYPAKASKTVLDFGWCALCRYGPDPTASPRIASFQAPGRENTCFGMIFARVSRETPSGKGNLSSSRTVRASTLRTSFSHGSKNPLARVWVPGSRIRSKTKTTSSAVTGRPSWKAAPGRRAKVQAVAVGSAGTSVASAGYGCREIGSVSSSPS